MANLDLPTMFDTQQAIRDQMEKDAQNAGRLPLGGGMMYASSLMGDLANQGLMGLAGMLGGAPDPRVAKQLKFAEIMEQFPDPSTPAELMELYHALNAGGLYNMAAEVMKQANEMRSSMPAPAEPKTFKDNNGATRYLNSGTTWNAGDLVPGESAMGTSTTPQTAEQISLAEFLVSPDFQSGKQTVEDWQKGWNLATSAGTSTSKYSTTEVKTEDEITGEDRIETWRVDPDGQITDTEPLFTQIKDADGGSTGIAMALNILRDNPDFQTALAANDSATINRMIKETTEAITPEEKKDRVFRLVDGVWRYTDGKQEKVFSDQDMPEDADAKAEEIYAEFFEKFPDLFATPQGNIDLAKQLVSNNLAGTKIFSDLMNSVDQDGQNAIRQEELTVRAIERLSENYVDSGVGEMDSLLAPIEAAIAADMKQVVKDGQVVWEGQLPGWDLTSSLDKWLPGSKGYAARQFAGQAASLINNILRQRSGAAVTAPEWDRLVQEYTGGRIKTSAQFANWVGRMRDYNEKTKGYVMAGYEPIVQNRFMANKGSYMTINPETEMGLVPIGGWFISSTDGKVYRRDK